MDWKQIAYGAEYVPIEYRKHWLDKNNQQIPLRGVWHPDNRMRFAATACERLHAIMFVAEDCYVNGGLSKGAWIACNPHLFADEATSREVRISFPLWQAPAPHTAHHYRVDARHHKCLFMMSIDIRAAYPIVGINGDLPCPM